MGFFRIFLSLMVFSAIAQNGFATSADAPTPSEESPSSDPRTGELSGALASWIDARARERLNEDQSPSISLAVVVDGNLVFQKGYGVTTIGEDTPPSSTTTYQIASVTKTFVGTLAAKFAAEERIDLDAPVTEYVPDFSPHPTAQNAPITLRLLLSHQAGFPRRAKLGYIRPDGLPDGFDVRLSKEISVEDLISTLAETPNIHPVGERYAYSGLGTALAAYAIAQAGGYATFEEALKAELLDPLGMTSTFVRSSEEHDADSATPYAFTSNKYNLMCPLGTEEYYEIPLTTFGDAVGGSGLTSNTTDMALYLGAIMDDGDVVTPEMKDILFTPNVEFLYTDELVYQMGLAWRMGHFGPYGVVYQHTGYNVGHHASILVSDEHDIGVIALTNGSYRANRRLAADVMLKLLQDSHQTNERQ